MFDSYCILISLTYILRLECKYKHNNLLVYVAAITVMFTKATYSVNENGGPAQPELVLTGPSTTNISVMITVSSSDGSATGKCY